MTVADIVTKIKRFAHDNSLTDPEIYDFINLAIKDLEDLGDFNWQLKKETVTVSSGDTEIPFTQTPVKRLISIDPEVELDVSGDEIKLASAVDEDTEFEVEYLYEHPLFDGAAANKIIPDDWVYIIGGTFYAHVYNETPEAAFWQEKWRNYMNNHYEKNMFRIPIQENTLESELSSV